MRKGAAMVVVCLLLMMAAQACGEARTYTYGGSEEDVLSDIAVSADGRIALAGYTASSDGTLSGRTKTGHSGWVLCVNAEGEVLWSFCRRQGNSDRMHDPVFHEDGTVTAVLESAFENVQVLEWLQFDWKGNVRSFGTLHMSHDPRVKIDIMGIYPGEGYVVREADSRTGIIRHLLYSFFGQYIRELDGYGGESAQSAVMMDGARAYAETIRQNRTDAQLTIIPPWE